jgi:hypothetical protein
MSVPADPKTHLRRARTTEPKVLQPTWSARAAFRVCFEPKQFSIAQIEKRSRAEGVAAFTKHCPTLPQQFSRGYQVGRPGFLVYEIAPKVLVPVENRVVSRRIASPIFRERWICLNSLRESCRTHSPFLSVEPGHRARMAPRILQDLLQNCSHFVMVQAIAGHEFLSALEIVQLFDKLPNCAQLQLADFSRRTSFSIASPLLAQGFLCAVQE